MRPLLFLISCVFMSSALFSSAAFAQQGMSPHDRPMLKMDGSKAKMGGGGHGMQEMMDVDGDGSVSSDEFKTFHSDHFKKADKNNDGHLDAPEFAMFSKIMAEERAKAMEIAKHKKMKRHFDKADTDKNGKISKAEFDAIGERRFNRMDHNDDGRLNQDDRGNKMSGMQGKDKPDEDDE